MQSVTGLPTMEACVQSPGSPSGICDGQSGTGWVPLGGFWFSLASILSTSTSVKVRERCGARRFLVCICLHGSSLTVLMITLMKQGQGVLAETRANRATQVQLDDGGSRFS
jgi:hypothetical protein